MVQNGTSKNKDCRKASSNVRSTINSDGAPDSENASITALCYPCICRPKENKFFNFDSDSDTSVTETNKQSYEPSKKAESLKLHVFTGESEELRILHRYPEIKAIFIKFNSPLLSSAAVKTFFLTQL